MKLYDFSYYAQRRAERKAAAAVAEVVSTIDQPGAVIVLKQRVHTWIDLHKEISRQTA